MSFNDAQTIINALQDSPNEWIAGHYELCHEPSGLILWIASGWSFLRSHQQSSVNVHLNLIDKIRVWRAYKRWCNENLHNKLNTYPRQD